MKPLRRYFFLWLLFCSVAWTNSVAQNIDSLKDVLKSAGSDSLKCETLIKLAEVVPEDELEFYNKQLGMLIEPMAKKKWDNARKSRLNYYLCAYYGTIAYIADTKGDVPRALEYYNKSLKLDEEIGNPENIAVTLNNLGQLYGKLGDIRKELAYMERSLKLQEQTGNQRGIARALNHLGVAYVGQGQYDKAFEYYQKSLQLREAAKDWLGMANSLHNLAKYYQIKGQTDKALDFYNRANELRKQHGGELEQHGSLTNMGSIYEERAEYEKAIGYYQQGLNIRLKTDDRRGQAHSYYSLGSVFLKQQNLKTALEYGNKAFLISRELGYPESIQSSSLLLYKIHKQKGDFEAALKYYKKFLQMRDSINNAETKKATMRSQLKYAYEKKMSADSVARVQENELQQAQLGKSESELDARKIQQRFLFGGLLLVVIFSLFMYNRVGVARKQKQIIEMQSEILQDKQKEIIDSIQYAKRIQQAHLPNESYLKKNMERLR